MLTMSVCVASVADAEVDRIEVRLGDRQLFLDDYIVERIDGLTRTVQQPVDFQDNPVMVSEHPWEHRRIPFGSVYYSADENKFRCWYLAMNIYDSRPGFRGYRKQHHVPLHEAAFLCYAESEDGLAWRKPELGLHEYRGSTKNNIVLTCPGSHFDSTSVMHTPHDAQHPWKMISFIGRWPYRKELIKKQWGEDFRFGVNQAAHYAWSSTDGIHWKPMNEGQPVLGANDRSLFWWDSQRRIYVASAKSSFQKKRAQRYAWSRDGVQWTITPTWINHADKRDHPGDHSEAAYGFRYGGQYVGFCEMRRIRKGQPVKINWELMTSRDGRHWHRPIRDLFIADGRKDSWRYQVLKIFANPPIERDGQLWIYYGGKTGSVLTEAGSEPFQALCLARLRKDGFVSLDAGSDVGSVTTKRFQLPNGKLRLNANATDGEMCVKLLDADGRLIAESTPIRGDRLDAPVVFDSPTRPGTTVSLEFTMRNCEMYSFWFEAL
jgi:hypothetical protein